MTTVEYNPQANGKVERFNMTMISKLSHYLAEHQNDWITFVFLLTYVYNVQVY